MNQFAEQFKQEGSVHIPGFFSKEKCTQVRQLFETQIKPSDKRFLRQTTTKHESHNFSEDGFVTNPLLNIHIADNTTPDFSDKALNLFESENLLPLLNSIFDVDPVLIQTMYFESSRGTNLHVDSDFVDSTNTGNMIGCWIPLEDIDEEAGRFCYYPKSCFLTEEASFDKEAVELYNNYRELCISSIHNFQNNIKSNSLQNAIKSQKILSQALQKSNLKMKMEEAKTGDLILFNSLTIHGSMKPKLNGKSRNSITAHFIAANTELIRFQKEIAPLNIIQNGKLKYHV